MSECSRDTHAGSPFLRLPRWLRGTADQGAGEGQEKALAPIVECDGRPIGNGKPGPITRQLRERYHQLVRQAT